MDGTKILSMIVENLYFLDSLNFMSMSLKSMPKSFDLNARRGIILTFLTRPTIWNMWALIPNPRSFEQTTVQAMIVPNFWNGMRIKKTKFSAISRNSWPTAWTMSMYCAVRKDFLKLVKMYPFRQAITISSICNEVFRTMFLKPDTVGIIPRAGYRMGDRQSLLGLPRLAYIGRTRNNITHAGNGRGSSFA
jgi:hypothetical protein